MPFVQAPDGCRLHYELHGDPAAEPLLLLEGMGGDIPGWGEHLRVLAREAHVVAYDFRGNGLSDKPDQPMTMATLVDDTLSLLAGLGLGSAHVYGQSLGGMVAQELALAHPDRVRSLILAATHAGVHHVVGRAAKMPKDRPWEVMFSRRFVDERPELVEEHHRVARRNPQPPLFARRQWEAMMGFDAHDRLPGLRVPTLVLHGTEDRMIRVENARVLAERIPGARLHLLEGAGHLYHWERPEESARAVVDFIRSVERSP